MNKNKYLYNFMRDCLGIICGLGALALCGCAMVNEPLRGNLLTEELAVRRCAEVYSALDAAIERVGVRDAEAYRIPGFPYLRIDRFGARVRDAVGDNDRAHAQWVSRLRALDQDARRVEISNLPEQEINALEGGGRAALLEKTMHCADTLRDHDIAAPERMQLLRARAQVPDDYATSQRVLGLYALTRIPFFKGISQWQSEAQQAFRDTHDDADGGKAVPPVMRYAYTRPPAVTREHIAAMIRRAGENPLRIPQYSDEERALLARAFAPVFEVATGGAYDRFGALRWATAAAPDVDASVPVVYHRVAFTRYGDQTLTQIVYTLWFPERPPDHALDMLAGRLDGVVFRVTLSPDGDPLIYDSIHPCGCYHLFIPTSRVEALPTPDDAQEWAFVPTTLAAHSVGASIVVRVASRTHYLVKVALDTIAPVPVGSAVYTLVPEDALRTLPVASGTRSAYGPDGLVPGTERAERFLFWPMGIASAGAMRQWGHHATAFVGRRHFDDADLIEKRFRIIAP